jgi:outer membrane biosynthesis protein TonB
MASGWFPLTGSALFVREETDDEEIESQEANKRLGSKVLESKLIHRVDPEYPELAGRARVEGEVTLKISVNEEGDVSNVEVISGHQLLRQAAVDAVKQWR